MYFSPALLAQLCWWLRCVDSGSYAGFKFHWQLPASVHWPTRHTLQAPLSPFWPCQQCAYACVFKLRCVLAEAPEMDYIGSGISSLNLPAVRRLRLKMRARSRCLLSSASAESPTPPARLPGCCSAEWGEAAVKAFGEVRLSQQCASVKSDSLAAAHWLSQHRVVVKRRLCSRHLSRPCIFSVASAPAQLSRHQDCSEGDFAPATR